MNKIIGIKAISFAADGTLLDFEKVMRHSLFHVLVELKKHDPEVADMLNIYKMIKIRNRVANELKGRVTNLEEIRIESLRQTLRKVDRPNATLARAKVQSSCPTLLFMETNFQLARRKMIW